jgi:hypothetical protein
MWGRYPRRNDTSPHIGDPDVTLSEQHATFCSRNSSSSSKSNSNNSGNNNKNNNNSSNKQFTAAQRCCQPWTLVMETTQLTSSAASDITQPHWPHLHHRQTKQAPVPERQGSHLCLFPRKLIPQCRS